MTVYSSFRVSLIWTLLLHNAACVESLDTDRCGQKLQNSKFFKRSLLQVDAIADHGRRTVQGNQQELSPLLSRTKNKSTITHAGEKTASPSTLQLLETKVKTHRQDIQDFVVLSFPFLAIMLFISAGLVLRRQTDNDETPEERLVHTLNKLASARAKKDGTRTALPVTVNETEKHFRIRPFVGDTVKIEEPRKDFPAHVYYAEKVGIITADNGSAQPFEISGMTVDPSTGKPDVLFFEDEVILVKRARHQAKHKVCN
eukprot:TRINITY_DN103819_c0_g1_i1.p1 TRINITY_DN103819_c0_g1~~TRINITY_DN103819_c0_g1_i1.p1  ORF type:complete len:257 (-),score=43.94 TRINITY_DN103819_c0_g1_i1:58-828(-)